MSSPAKISANRENARKSTGPRSERGKSKSRLNALKFGIYAMTPVLPGEDENVYREITKSNLSHFAPVGPVENMLVRQITAEQWRLERIQMVENALPDRLIDGQIGKFLVSLNETETDYISSSYAGELSEELQQAQREQQAAVHLLEQGSPANGYNGPRREFPIRTNEETNDNVEARLGRILEPDNALLVSLVPNTERAPQSYLVQERRVAMRTYLAYVGKLQELQEDRKTVTLSSRHQSATAAEKHTNAKRSAPLLVEGAANQNQSEVGNISLATPAPLPTPKAD
jgi:hypothetical protein